MNLAPIKITLKESTEESRNVDHELFQFKPRSQTHKDMEAQARANDYSFDPVGWMSLNQTATEENYTPMKKRTFGEWMKDLFW